MALFTTQEASASTITRCECIFSDSGQTNCLYYVMGITDADGIYYDWKDFTTPHGSDADVIKLAIYDYLTTNVNKVAPTSESAMEDGSVVGSNPG